MKKIFLLSLILISTINISKINAYSDKTILEKSYTEKVQTSLDSIYGKDVFFVIVDVDLSAPSYKVRYTEESTVKTKSKKSSKINIMPGYPVIKNLGPGDAQRLPFDSVTNYIPPRIRKVNVDLYVNKSYSKSRARKAIRLVRNILKLKDSDVVSLKKQTFYRKPVPKQTIQITGSEQQLLTYQNLYYGITIIFFIVFLLLYVIFQIKNKNALAKSGRGKGSGQTNVNVNPNLEVKGGGGAGGDIKISQAPPIKKYFDFISEDNIHKLLYIMKEQKLSLEQISTLISFTNPKLASLILNALDVKTQSLISLNLLKEKLNDKHSVEKLEAQIQNWLECLSGGRQTFTDTFEHMPSENKKLILQSLRVSNPQGYMALRQNILIFDDVKFLDDEEIKSLLSETSVEILAIALASVDQETYKRIDQNLTKSARDMIEQFLDLKGQSLTKKDIDAAQNTILLIAKTLESEGKLKLRSKIKG